jgi:hypothetical protein
MRRMMTALVAFFLVGIISGVTEIALHGFSFFLFRNAGTGAGNARNLDEDQGPGQPDAGKTSHQGRQATPGGSTSPSGNRAKPGQPDARGKHHKTDKAAPGHGTGPGGEHHQGSPAAPATGHQGGNRAKPGPAGQ